MCFQDVRGILRKWDIDLDNIICNPLLNHEIIILGQKFRRHNFEFVMDFTIQSILRDNKFSKNDLLTLANFAIAIYFDHDCKQMSHIIKELFSTCIETALLEDNETDIIIFAQELYSKHETHLVKITRDLFFPVEGQIMRKIYSYLTFKLYKSLTGRVDCNIQCPSVNEW